MAQALFGLGSLPRIGCMALRFGPDTSQDLAERMLGDPKMEVADVAAATLSGFLRAAPPAAAAAARARYMAAVQDGMASHRLKRRRRKDGLADGQSDSAGGCLPRSSLAPQ